MTKKLPLIARIGLGILLVAFGTIGVLNIFIQFAPPVQYSNPVANQFITGINNAQYIPGIVSVLGFVAGILLIINRFVPLALVLYTPISVNIILFHLFLDMKTILPALVVVLLNVYLLVAYMENYKPFLKAKNELK
ncbi:DoxX protein [Shimazuella alba]|uniref:DoxX protein n=1 Tax=Shimazuella alba TaxID=2690964 RepID=A0A6I4VWR3_9BACL|nr:DoxX protein [Shimazuella alba]MXQ52904.1 DoxX protein [Shimazuella alba]